MDNDEEKLLVQAALDSSPKGFGNVGACSFTVSASVVETDEKAGCSLWPIPCACCLCCTHPGAESLGMIFSASLGLHSAPTSAHTPVPVIILVSVNTLPPAAVWTPPSVPVHTAALDPVNTLPSGQVLAPTPGSMSVPLIPSWSLVPKVAERSEGMAGSRCKTPRLSESW